MSEKKIWSLLFEIIQLWRGQFLEKIVENQELSKTIFEVVEIKGSFWDSFLILTHFFQENDDDAKLDNIYEVTF